ncbi:MAG: hypothetical protein ACLT3H_02820 [Roseburia sp.]
MEFDTENVKFQSNYSGSEIEQIKTGLRVLYATKAGSQPMDREFGLNIDFIGTPLPVAKNKFTLEVVRKTAMYEPRVSVKEVTFSEDQERGMLVPEIHFEKGATRNE